MTSSADRIKENLRHYLDLGSSLSSSLSKMSRSDLENLVHQFVESGTGSGRERVERAHALEELRARGRRGAEQLFDTVRGEVHREFEAVSGRREELADLIEHTAGRIRDLLGSTGRNASSDESAAKTTAPKKTAAKKTVAKTVAKKTVAKKTVAKKTGAKKVPAKKAAVKSPAKKATVKKAAPKKTAAKKTPAKKVAAKVPAKKAAPRTAPSGG